MILPPAALTPSGRPQLVPGEVERQLLDKVDIEFEGSGCTEGCAAEGAYKNGYAVATSHRLLWIDAAAGPASAGRSAALPLGAIHSVSKRVQYSLNLINPKVRLEVKLYVDHTMRVADMQRSATFKYLNLRCRGEAPDTFHDHLSAALQAHRSMAEQQQQQQQRLQQQQQQPQPLPGSPGRPAAAHVGPRAWPLDPASFNSSGGGAPWGGAGPPSGGGVPSPRAASAARPQPQLQAVDADLLAQLVDMGFPRARVVRALLATNSETLQAALDWILAACEEPAMDAPLSYPEPAAVSKQELQRLRQLQLVQLAPGPLVAAQQQQQLQQLAHAHAQAQAQSRGSQQQPLPGWGLSSVSAAGGMGSPGLASWGSGPQSGGTGSPRRAPGAPSLLAGPGRPLPGSDGDGSGSGSGTARSGSRVIGVAGIMHREAEKTQQATANLAAAFRDLDHLMSMAADMVALAEKFRGVMGPDGSITLSAGSGGAGEPGGELLLDAETQLQLVAMGIASPVTRASAGARFHIELSRQLADFLDAPLRRAGGVMVLADVYCLFNRARGTELVSPDDLLAACEAFAQVGLPLRLRRFPSGVIVVQGAQFSDAQLCSRIQQLLQAKAQQQQQQQQQRAGAAAGLGPPLSASDVSSALSLPLTLAGEALLVAEASGVVCRDDGPEGLRFFRNFFADTAAPLAVR